MKNFEKDGEKSPDKGKIRHSQVENFKLEDVLQKLPIGIAIVDPDTGKFIFVNSNFAVILGYPVEELLEKTFQAITHPGDLGKNIELHDKLRRREIDSYSIEKQNVRKDGSVVWVNLTAIRFRDINNREFHLGAIFDLSARKLAEQQLAASEELLRNVITNAPISIFATDENGVFTLHEGKAIERVGMKPGDNVGASAYDLFAGLKVTEHNGTVIAGKSVLDRVSNGEYLSGITELNDVFFDNQFAPIFGQDGKITGLLGVATDITDQKQMERERLEFESRYRMLFNQIDEGFCIIEMIFDENQRPIDYRFLEINPVFEKQTGLKDAQGKRILELVPTLEKYWFENYGRIALTGIPERFVNRAEQFNRWYDVYAFRFGQPEKRQVAVLFNDITQRKRTEDDLHEREDKWRNLFEILPVGVSIVNTQNNTLEINDALSRILDIPKDELISGAYRNRSYFRPDMTVMQPEEFPSLRVLNEKKIIKDVEIGIKKEDGSMIWTNVSAAPMSSLENCVTVTTDITHYKKALEKIAESEQKLNEAERIGNSGSWDYDVASDTATWSKNMFRIFDVDPETPNELVFKNFIDNLVYPEDQEHVRSVFSDAIAGKQPYDLEYRIVRKDGSIRNVHAIAETLFDETGRAVRMIGKMEDISARKKWEEEMRYRAEVATQISDGISLIRIDDGILVHTSQRYEEMFGYQRGEMLGKHATILNMSDPNQNAAETHKMIMDAVREKEKWKGVVHNVKKDGTPFWTQASVSTIVHPRFGKVVLSVQMDVTERIEAEIALQKNEKLLTAMVSNISDVIAIVDEHGINRFKSANLEKWFGWKP